MRKWVRKTGLSVLLIFGLVVSQAYDHNAVVQAKAKATEQSVVAKVGTKNVNKKTYTMKKGSSKQIRLVVTPKKPKVTVTYRSNKRNVVSVSKTGVLKAKRTGTAKISMKVSGKGNFQKKLWFKVKVVASNHSDKKKEIPVTLTVSGKKFAAKFYDNQTTRALVKKMPITLSMKELNGNEKYYYFSESFPTNETSSKKIQAGEIKLYGSDCLVVFYKSFSTSYSYTSLGYVENPEGLADVVGTGNVSVEIVGIDE